MTAIRIALLGPPGSPCLAFHEEARSGPSTVRSSPKSVTDSLHGFHAQGVVVLSRDIPDSWCRATSVTAGSVVARVGHGQGGGCHRIRIAVASEGLNVAASCGQQGISSQTIYQWRRRYQADGQEGLEARSRTDTHAVVFIDHQVIRAVALDPPPVPTQRPPPGPTRPVPPPRVVRRW